MDYFWAARSLRILVMMVADTLDVPVLVMILVGGEALSPPTVRHVWTLATVASCFSAVTWSSKTLTYEMKAVSRFRGGGGGINGAVFGAAGGGGVVVFYSRRTLVWLLPHVSVLEGETVRVEFCEVLYGGFPRLGGRALVLPCYELYFREVVADVHVLYKKTTFSYSRQGTPMVMDALALRVSSHVYFVM